MGVKRVCRVLGRDKNSGQVTALVEADTVLEAAVRGMDEIRSQFCEPCDVTVIVQLPEREFTVTRAQILKWASTRHSNENMGLVAAKSRVREFLTAKKNG